MTFIMGLQFFLVFLYSITNKKITLKSFNIPFLSKYKNHQIEYLNKKDVNYVLQKMKNSL